RPSDPGEVGVIEVCTYLVHLHLRVALTRVADELLDEREQSPLLLGVERRGSNARVVEDHVVPERFADVVVARLRDRENRGLSLHGVEGIDERTPLPLFVLEDGGALELAGRRDDRL